MNKPPPLALSGHVPLEDQFAPTEAQIARKALMNAEDRIDELIDALQKIQSWSEAYPVDIFPEPDMKQARELLRAGGITLDAVAASISRHVITGVGEIAREALAKTTSVNGGEP